MHITQVVGVPDLLLLLLLLPHLIPALPMSEAVGPRDRLLCQICTDVVTELDGWLTEDTTEEEIAAFVEQVPARSTGQLNCLVGRGSDGVASTIPKKKNPEQRTIPIPPS